LRKPKNKNKAAPLPISCRISALLSARERHSAKQTSARERHSAKKKAIALWGVSLCRSGS